MVAFLVLTVTVACSDDGEGADAVDADTPPSADASTTTGLPTCDDERQLVVFHLNGTLTTEDEIGQLLNDSTYDMTPRTGAAELTNAYFERGYELVYTTRGTDDIVIGDRPYSDVLASWLERHSFPYGDRATLWQGMTGLPLRQELLTHAAEGATVYAGYSTVLEDVEAFVVAGVPRDRIHTFEELPEIGETTVLAGDLTPHLSDIQDLAQVCRTE